MASTIQIRVDDELKAKSDELFKDLGTDTTTAIRMFLTQALSVNGFPFEIKRARTNPYEALSEAEFLEKLEKSRQNVKERFQETIQKEDLDRFIQYLIFEKKSTQAARNVLDDYDATIECLKHVAGSLKLCENPRLRMQGYHRINFLNHRYFMMYRIGENIVFVDNIFHELQDYENKMC